MIDICNFCSVSYLFQWQNILFPFPLVFFGSRLICSSELKNDRDDHSVEAEHFREDENQNQRDKDLLVHREALNTLFANEADRVPRSKL